ncbi:hypothetical protein KC717_05355 [Candidatus Dojkabacteria bacterium]|uniref:Phage major capsid protein n=1 Tax=Candidatus Dojkabacteria bacterium TaxID=2099670 RepID=A0A955L9C9_9BACT|nr:hypothetical protein [Candidatus Dojkabacteria bacterium]
MSNAAIRHNEQKSKILTAYAHGFTQAELIGTKVLPIVAETQKNLEVPIFGQDSFVAVNTERAVGGTPAEGTSEKVTTTTVNLKEYSYSEKIDRLEYEDGDTFNLKKSKSRNALQKVLNGQEARIAAAVNDYASYGSGSKETLTSTDQWTHASSDPYSQIMDAIASGRSKLGVAFNTLTMGPDSWNALIQNVKLNQKLSDGRVGLTNMKAILQLLDGIENIYVGYGVSRVGTTNSFIWTDNAILSYTTTNKNPNRFDPSFGFTFQKKGHPYITESQDQHGNIDYFTAYLQDAPTIVSYDAAYILKDTNA